MKLFKMIFTESFNKFYNTFTIIGIIALFLSSCSTSKETSLAYMDDIYYDTYSNPVVLNTVEEHDLVDESGEAPSNVPGAAYVYTPIPEPTITTPYPDQLNPYYGNNYYNDPFGYNNYPYSYAGNAYDAFYLTYGLSFGYGYGSYNPCVYTYIPPSEISNSNYISSKRFQWNNNSNDNYQYTSDIEKESSGSSGSSGSSTNERERGSSKSTFWNSLISSGSSGDSSNDYNRSNSNSSRSGSGSATPSRSSSSRSSGPSRSSGSSKSYSGKRQR